MGGPGIYTPALEAGITSPYAHLDQYVVCTTLPTGPDPHVRVGAEDPVELVRRLKAEPGVGIWLAGGARLAGALLPEIDQLVLKRYPIVLGAGIPVIAASQAHPQAFTATDERALGDGTTITTYTRTP